MPFSRKASLSFHSICVQIFKKCKADSFLSVWNSIKKSYLSNYRKNSRANGRERVFGLCGGFFNCRLYHHFVGNFFLIDFAIVNGKKWGMILLFPSHVWLRINKDYIENGFSRKRFGCEQIRIVAFTLTRIFLCLVTRSNLTKCHFFLSTG